jgi:hypothetical protein
MRHETPVENPGSWIILWKYWDFEWIRSALRAFKRWSHNRLKKVCKAVGRAPVWQCYNAKDIPNGVQFWFTLLHMDEFHLHKKKCILIPSYFHAPESKHEIKHCRPQEQNHVWDSIFSDLLEFPWKSHICPSNPPKNDALINGEIRNHLEQSILSRLSHFKRFSCQRGRIAQRSPRTRRAPQWQDSSLGYSGNFWDVHLPSTHLWFLWCFDLKFLAYSNGLGKWYIYFILFQ